MINKALLKQILLDNRREIESIGLQTKGYYHLRWRKVNWRRIWSDWGYTMLEMVDPTIITINDICGSLNANSIDSQLAKMIILSKIYRQAKQNRWIWKSKAEFWRIFHSIIWESQVIYANLCHTYEIKEKKNQVCGNILYLLVCFLSNSSGWSAEVPDVGWLFRVIRISGAFSVTVGYYSDSGGLHINKRK